MIGCDGANSVVADFLGLKPPKFFSLSEVRGFTEYPSGHDFNNEFVQVWGENSIIGRIPMDNKLVYWFVTQKMNTKGTQECFACSASISWFSSNPVVIVPEA